MRKENAVALLTTYGAGNKIVDSGLAVTYSRKRVYGEWSYASGTSIITIKSAWVYTRCASKSYRYVGMTKTAAESCATALREKFQRNTMISEWSSEDQDFKDVEGGEMPMAEISVNYVDGQMYEVAVVVSETDERMRKGAADVSVLFATENTRDYD